jgi:putative aminopeptidase FrvX
MKINKQRTRRYLDSLLERLTLANGVGYAGDIRNVVSEELGKLHLKSKIERDGSVHAVLSGTGKMSVMFACHIDEIGFMVSSIDDHGRIYFSEIGGVDPRILPGQEVTILSKQHLKGYIGAKPPHFLTKKEANKVLSIDKLFVDTGIAPDALKKIIKIGDCISFTGKYEKLQGNLRSAKSLDNRASVACGILALKNLSRVKHSATVHFVATSQEEYTGLGATIHSYKLPINCAIVVDVTFAEHPDLKDYEYLPLDKGPAIGRGATIPEKLFQSLVKTAKQSKIAYQVEALPTYTGTDADSIAFNREGIPTCVISIPLRYMHTPVEVVSLKDIEKAAQLVVNFVKKL